MSCDPSEDEMVEKEFKLETPTIDAFKGAVNGVTRDFYEKSNDSSFNFLPDWNAIQRIDVGNSNAEALAAPVILNATVNGVAKVIAINVNGDLIAAIQVEHIHTTDSSGNLQNGRTF